MRSEGLGKTEALHRFKDAARGVYLHRAVKGEGEVWKVANELCRLLEIEEPNGRKLADTRRSIANALGAESMLVFDEAQHLVQGNTRGRDDWDAFEWLRALAEEGMLSLAFCGHLSLCQLRDEAPSLWSRMRPRTVVRRSPKADVEIIAHRWGATDPESVRVLYEVARRSGGALRDVVNVCREATIMAGDGPLTHNHILAAIEDLNLLAGRVK